MAKPIVTDSAPVTSEPVAPVAAPVELGVAPCRGPVTDGPPAIVLHIGSARVELPMASCGLTVAAGSATFALLVPYSPDEKPEVAVAGAVGGWDGEQYKATLQVEQNRLTTVTFDLKEMGRPDPVTYTLLGVSPVESFFAAALDRKGPWTPVTEAGLVPAETAWLRVTYPMPMQPGGPSPVMPDQYLLSGRVPGEWEGNRTQYLAIGSLLPVLFVRDVADVNGLRTYFSGMPVLYRGLAPELQAINPVSGAVRTTYRFSDVPGRLELWQGSARYNTAIAGKVAYWQVDLFSGQLSSAAAPEPPSADDRLRFPSPNGKLVAELTFAEGRPGHASADKQYVADLVIRDQSTGEIVVKQDGWLSSWGSYSCSNPTPGFGWRADSTAVAVLDAPDRDHLSLKMIDLQGASKVIAQIQNQSAAYGQYVGEVVWSPSGSMIKYANQVVDVISGRVVSEKLPLHAFWSFDSQHLLLYQPDHPFTRWGALGLLEVATGKRQELGHGQGLGWAETGEAFMVRWDVSRQIPPPGKGCP